jgi:DNA-binding response OmpR family regulator
MKSILLVEDDPFLIDIYTTKLKEEGFAVEVADDGEEVMAKIAEVKPDLMLLDIVLPNVNGWEILRRVKKDATTKDLKIIILSNLAEKEEVEKGMSFGANKYLVKAHYTPTEVIKEITKIFE